MKRSSRGEQELLAEFQAARREMAASAIEITDMILDAAVKKLDATFGAGFAKANPILVGHYIEATSETFRADLTSIAEGFDLPLDDLDRRR